MLGEGQALIVLMDQTLKPSVADEAGAVLVRRAADSLKAIAETRQSVRVSIDGPDGSFVVPLPASAVTMLHAMLDAMANQMPISLLRHDVDQSTQQAMDFLNVSRPFLIRQLEGGARTSCTLGAHRELHFSDLVACEGLRQQEQLEALADLHNEEKRLSLE